MKKSEWNLLGLFFALLLSACTMPTGTPNSEQAANEWYQANSIDTSPVVFANWENWEEVTTAEERMYTDVSYQLTSNSNSWVVEGININTPYTDVEQLIIYTGQLSMVVVDTEEAMATIARLVGEHEGWVVSSNSDRQSYQNGDVMTGNMKVRVPAGQFDTLMSQIKDLALEVSQESRFGQDVTEEYVDLSARLTNLERATEQLQAFLTEAQNVQEALVVYEELSRLEGEIESYKARIQYLAQLADFSLITINLTPDVLSQPIEMGNWQAQGIVRNALESLIETLQMVASGSIWLVFYALPLLLMVGLPVWLIGRGIRRRRSGRVVTQN